MYDKDHKSSAYAPLTAAEERSFFKLAREGSKRARDSIIRRNLYLVPQVVSTYTINGVSREDVIQEGVEGLMQAFERFDLTVGTRFSTYAVWWIRARVGAYLQHARSVVRAKRATVATHDHSLDTPVTEDGDVTHLDLLMSPEDDQGTRYLKLEDDKNVADALNAVRKRLGPVGCDIVFNRLASDNPSTLQEIASRHGVSRERIRQVEVKVKKFLKEYLAERMVA